MPSIRQLTLSSFCLLLTVWGVTAGGSRFTNAAASSESPPPVTKSSTIATQAKATATLNKVKVFFPRSPKSAADFTYVEPVSRTTASRGLATFAIEQLIAGPTSKEKAIGLLDPINLSGSSNCGKNFTFTISKKVAKLQFCKQVVSGGSGDDARLRSSINATLKQFSPIASVRVLDKNGNCLGDQSGENFCLKNP